MRHFPLWLGLALASCAVAQQPKTTQIVVTVVDQTGAIIPGADVSVESDSTGTIARKSSSPQGAATFDLIPGKYKLTVQATAFLRGVWPITAADDPKMPGSPQAIVATLRVSGNGISGPVVAQEPLMTTSETAPVASLIAPLPLQYLEQTRAIRDRGKHTKAVVLPPDLILFNGNILTGEGLEQKAPRFETAIAIADGKVTAIGSDRVIKPLAGSKTQLRDLHGAFAMPGLNDAHLHLGYAGQTKLHVDLTGSASLKEMLKRIEAKAAETPDGHWLTGGGWDHTLWAAKTLPTRQDLDAVTGNHPAFLERIDGHIAVANSIGLKALGITPQTLAPKGGAIDLDEAGRPTGILRDTAMEQFEKLIPKPSREERRRGDELALADAASHGLTSVQDNSDWEDFLIYEELEKEGKLPVRVSEWLAFTDPVAVLEEHRAHHAADDPMLHTGMLKGFMDGSLGSRTAAMKEPYADEPKNSGLPRYEQDKLDAMAVERARAGFQLGFHAIGDRAASMALDAFSQQLGDGKTVATGHRDRIEHAQVVDPADVARFASLGVVASMQPNHLLTDMNWAMDRLGPKRAAYSYAWMAFLDAGVVVAFGTDYPVEPVTPFRGLYAAVTRANEAGTKTYFPENKLTIAQAIYAYTQGSAYAEVEEDKKGKLLPGYYADLIVLDRNLLTIPAPEILKTKVLETIVGGKTVYKANY